MGIRSGNPALDQYNEDGVMTPTLQKAADIFRTQHLPGLIQSQAPQQPTQQPANGPTPQLTQPPQQMPSVVQPQQSAMTATAAPPSHAQQEMTRLTDPTLQSSKSGIDQIHNPWLRTPLKVLDAIGSAFIPSLTMGLPGTQFHHQLLVNQARGNVGQEQESAKEQAGLANLNAQTTETQKKIEGMPAEEDYKKAQAEHARAQAHALQNPTPKEKPIGSVTTVNGKVMQFNPKTDLYDIEVGSAEKPGHEGLVQDKEGNYIGWTDSSGKHHALDEPETPPAIKKISDTAESKYHPDAKKTLEEQIIDEHQKKVHPGETMAAARQHTAVAPPVDHGATVIDPQSGQVVRLVPGMRAPEGFRGVNQQGSLNTPTSQMRNVGAQASLVHEQTPHMLSEIDRLKDKLGPLTGQWNEFMQGKVGLNDPDMAGLRTDLLMYSSAVALMHARGRLPENLREEFDRTINSPKQSPENLKRIISRIDDWTGKNLHTMQGDNSQGGGGKDQLPGGISLQDIDAELARRKGAKK